MLNGTGKGPPLVVGIAGGSASGKSAVVREVVRRLAPLGTAVVPHDAYYHDLSGLTRDERRSWNFDHPEALETDRMIRDVQKLIDGSSTGIPTYDFATNARAAETRLVSPAPVIIIEGILVLAEAGLRELIDLGVFIDVPEADRLARRLRRDVRERGRKESEVRTHHSDSVQPMHERFVRPSRRFADVVIGQGAKNLLAIDSLCRRIREARARHSTGADTPEP